jgi:cob(I)alamin adenosyltransferase
MARVRLDRIYTRGGDKGMTSLGDGTRVPKTQPRIAAYGMVDELNAVLGLVTLQRDLGAQEQALLRRIQNELFDVGADLCVPRAADEAEGARLRVTSGQVRDLEVAIDARTARLEPLMSFVLPGGRGAAAWLHLARVVCRRAELQVAFLVEIEPDSVGPQVLVYLNRLSDLLFVMARLANDGGRGDVLWQPGQSRDVQPAVKPRTSSRAPGGASRARGGRKTPPSGRPRRVRPRSAGNGRRSGK